MSSPCEEGPKLHKVKLSSKCFGLKPMDLKPLARLSHL